MSYLIKVLISTQQLELYDNEVLIKTYPISTAAKGIGQQYGSMQTPLGKHSICEKIGEGAPINTVFKARVPTGELYTPELETQTPECKDWMLTRILWLEGLEEGFNKGGNVDSKNRKIYIHASPDARPMRQPFSHGCVTLHNANMLELFDLVQVGTQVSIENNESSLECGIAKQS